MAVYVPSGAASFVTALAGLVTAVGTLISHLRVRHEVRENTTDVAALRRFNRRSLQVLAELSPAARREWLHLWTKYGGDLDDGMGSSRERTWRRHDDT